MCEGAEVAVFAECGVVGVGLAVLALVATGVVQLFDLVVGLLAGAVATGAWHMGVLVEVGAAAVLFVVVVEAHLALVLLWVREGYLCGGRVWS